MAEHQSIYTNEAALEPLMPTDPSGRIREAASRLMTESAKLAGSLHPRTRARVAELVSHMNSYYSNLIEGHHTHPADIERALKNDYSSEPAKRALQLESAAHVKVETLMRERLLADNRDICTAEFVQWLHREFYARMPEEFRVVGEKKQPIEPGELRQGQVTVGRHLAPDAHSLPRFMARFAAYEPGQLDPLDRVIAAAAAHHRLAWIHPFQDGNGRVVRLFTHAYLARAGVETAGLWAISRGLARRRDEYHLRLAEADEQRRNDLDGRGNLSNEALVAFCDFFLETARDQVRFMAATLDLDSMQDRIMLFATRWSTLHRAPPTLGHLLCEAFVKGSVSRGAVGRLLGVHERTGRKHAIELVERRLLDSEGPGAPLTIAFSSETIGYLFPRLYPEGVELTSGE